MSFFSDRFSSQKWMVALTVLGLFAVCVYPFAVLFTKILFPSGAFSTEVIIETLRNPTALKAFYNTVLVSLSVGVLSLLIGVPLGWLIGRTDLPLQGRLRSWFCLPYAVPPYIGAIAWISLANPTNGLLNHFLPVTLNIYSFSGLIWVETTFLYTFVLLTALSSLDRMDASLEEAARLSGAGPFKVFKDITLPLIRPALLSGFLLVVLAAAASFGVPAMIGSPAGIYLVTTQIYTLQKMGSVTGLYKAGSLSLILLAMTFAFLLINQRISRKSQYRIVSGKTSRPGLIELGRWRWPLFGFLVFVLSVLFILPLGAILLTALSQVQGQLGWTNLTFDNFLRILFEVDETPRALGNSFFIAALAATAATLFGTFIAYIQWKTRLPGRQWLDVIASFPYSTPGTVVALALILAFSQSFFGFGSLYNTVWILFLAYGVKYLSFSIKTSSDGYLQIDDCLAEAARVSGASWGTVLRTIWLPLLKPSLIASWFLIFMPAFSELTMTILLAGPGTETVGTLLFQLQEYSDTGGGGAAVLSVIVVLTVILANASVKKISKGKYGL